ncbi:hypothetical protein ACFC1R_04805 [Kitasatospora sp. NPDC056138]|uniref:hypothetical protein n=1 Tax=Kitasatospora sp. NPDC056138 TaxID=3345724 RepID=UPI0035E0EF62
MPRRFGRLATAGRLRSRGYRVPPTHFATDADERAGPATAHPGTAHPGTVELRDVLLLRGRGRAAR